MSAAQEFHAVAVMALADGHLVVQERDLLLRCAEWLGLPRPEAAWIVTRVIRARRGPAVVVPVDPVVKERLFCGLINVAIADGVVSPQETRCLQSLAPSFGVDAARVPEILRRANGQPPAARDWPESLMLTMSRSREEEIRIVDFGIARAVHVLESSEDPDQLETPVGTIGYMSPEQARCKRLDPSSDIYSMGVVLYELVSGRLPIVADPNTAHVRRSFLSRLLNAAPVPLADHVPDPLRAVIEVALRKDPEERFQAATEFREALLRAIDPDRDTGRFSRWLSRRGRPG